MVAIDGTEAVDVSSDPAFAPLFRADMVRARAACERRITEAEGPCAGYAFDAARLGELDEAMAVIAAQVRRGCRIADEEPCGSDRRIDPAFPADLTALLRKLGYTR